MELSFNIDRQALVRKDRFRIVANSKNYVMAQFKFSDDWIGKTKTVIFQKDDTQYPMLLDETNFCQVPNELLRTSGGFRVSVVGVGDGSIITTNLVSMQVHGGFEVSELEDEVTPSLFEQIMNKLLVIQNGSIDSEQVARCIEDYLSEHPIENLDASAVQDIVASYINRHKEELRGRQGLAGKDGLDGRTPVKGLDYWTSEDLEEFTQEIAELVHTYFSEHQAEFKGTDGATPQKGVDYFTSADVQSFSEQLGELVVDYFSEHSSEFKGDDGNDGITPVKGVDYWTSEDVAQFDMAISELINTYFTTHHDEFVGEAGRDGQDGQDGRDGQTPVVGIDYFTEEDKNSFIATLINYISSHADDFKGRDGADGKTPVSGTDYWTDADKAQVVDQAKAAATDYLQSHAGEFRGATGASGEAGQVGEAGKSAYEIAVEEGFEGTKREWLNSLKGEKGDKGDDGNVGSIDMSSYAKKQDIPSLDGVVFEEDLKPTQDIIGKYNVLDYGLVGDGKTDNTVALRTMINTIPWGSIIFFPRGIYNISDSIAINKSVYFVGETTTQQRYISASKEPNTNHRDSVINYVGNTADITLFEISNSIGCDFKGLTFFGHAYEFNNNEDEFKGIPYPYFKSNTLIENVNCLSRDGGIWSVENCMFLGFSGYAVKIHHNIYVKDCGFYECAIGILEEGTDSNIQNCFFTRGGTAIVTTNSVFAGQNIVYTNLNVCDCWCDQMSEHFIKAENTGSVMYNVDNAWVDMIDMSAISVPNDFLKKSNIQGRFSRCGMMYAGLTGQTTTAEIADKACVIYAKKIISCQFNIMCDKRPIGNGNNSSGYCPYKLAFVSQDGMFTESSITTDLTASDVCPNNYRANVRTLPGEDFEYFGVWKYDLAKVSFRTSSPVGKIKAPRANILVLDTKTNIWYRSTAANDINAWVTVERVPHYDKMPEDAEIVAMPDGTVFETDGYHEKGDGAGGKYRISYKSRSNSKQVSSGEVTRYLRIVPDDGADSNVLDVVKFGLKPYVGDLSDSLNTSDTFATYNSSVMAALTNLTGGTTLRFGFGRFVFENPIVFASPRVNFKGVETPMSLAQTNVGYANGTVLCFPFLTNGQAAIETEMGGNFEDIMVYGSLTTYNISFDRKKTLNDQQLNPVVTEVKLAECTGIKRVGGGHFRNVSVIGFYTGIDLATANWYLDDIFCQKCHFGLVLYRDAKCVGIYGKDVHTLAVVRSSSNSIQQLRVDSCVHAVNVRAGHNIILNDIDGDYCTESLIDLGDDSNAGEIYNASFTGLHGRCCALKAYDTRTYPNGLDVRNIDNTDGYGVIRLRERTKIYKSYFQLSSNGGRTPFDSNQGIADWDKYECPHIVISFASSEDESHNILYYNRIKDTMFVVSTEDIKVADDVLKYFEVPPMGTPTFKVDTSSGTYFVNGSTVSEYLQGREFTEAELLAMW